MAYPLSSTVSAGQPTAADHYNNLRDDALYLGMGSSNAITLGAFLAALESGLKLELLETDRIRVPASTAAPVYLMVNGYMLKVTSNVDLATGSKPSGVAAQYFIFAQRSGSATAFTLTVNTSSTEGTDQRRIGGFYWDGSQIENSSIYVEWRDKWLDNLGMKSKHVFGGRITLSSGEPVPENAVNGGTVYYTPYLHNLVSIYGNGYGWKEHTFTELSLSLAGATGDQPVDIFLYDDAGTLKLEYVEWTNASTRAVALTTQDGTYVKNGDPTKIYLGTLGIESGGGTSRDDDDDRMVWNMYNRVWRPMSKSLGTDSWTYETATWRAASGSEACYIEYVVGLAEERISMIGGLMMLSSASNMAAIGIGNNVTNADAARVQVSHVHNSIGPALAVYDGVAAIGQRKMHLVEIGNTGVTFYGDNGSSIMTGGLSGGMVM